MKRKFVFVLLVIVLLIVMQHRETAVLAQNNNLLTNPGFDNGHHHQNGIAEVVVPDGWELHWLDGVPFDGTFENPAARPESVVWLISDAPANERTLYFRNGSYTLKLFKSWAPVWMALSQDVSGLQVGKTYRFVVPIYVDVFSDYQNGTKIPPPPEYMQATKIRLGASSVEADWFQDSAFTYSRWWTGADTSPFYMAYNTYSFDFTATQANMTVWVEMVSSYPAFPNHGFFLDALELYAVGGGGGNSGAVPPVELAQINTATPGPSPTPRADGAIVHIVQSGDSLWTIAIQYAPTLGLTAEEALATIQELNNNPAFINPGDEIIVQLPTATATPEPTAELPTATLAAETAVSQPTATTAPATSNTVCVAAFNDVNGDGLPDESEGFLADAIFNLLRGGNAVATYISTGANEPYCFADLEADTYQIQYTPPTGFHATTTDSWAIAVADGKKETIQFGSQQTTEVANATPPQAQPTNAVAGVSTLAPTTSDTSGIFSNIGTIILAAVVVLVLLAVVGVILLRRA